MVGATATAVELAGEYDGVAELEAVLPVTGDYVFIDLGAVTFMDIACIDFLRRYPRATLHNVPPIVDRVLDVLAERCPAA